MDILQRAMDTTLSEVPWTVLGEIIVRKFSEQGITLSRQQKDELKTLLPKSENLDLDLDSLFSSWNFPERDDDVEIRIHITDEDTKAIDEAVDKVVSGMPEMVESVSTKLADSTLRSLRRSWPRQARYERQQRKGFQDRLEKRWGKALDLLAMFLTIATELGESINSRVRETSEHPYLVEVLTRLHARACQVTSEIVTLLRNGFADGAMARWRTLHEIAVVSLFVGEHGEGVAERYLLHEVEESRRAAQLYQRYADKLGYEPYSHEELEELDRQCQALEQRFGDSFKGDYGWAWEQLHPKKPTFATIEASIGTDHLRPFYRLAGNNVHANPKGVTFKLGLMDDSEVLLTGASDFGLADPAQNTAISLMQVTSSLSLLDSNIDTIIALKILSRLSDEIDEMFVTIQQAMEHEVTSDGSSSERHR